MAAPKTARPKKVAHPEGEITYIWIKPAGEGMVVMYRCRCTEEGTILAFHGDAQKQTCRACKQQYQLQVVIGPVVKK